MTGTSTPLHQMVQPMAQYDARFDSGILIQARSIKTMRGTDHITFLTASRMLVDDKKIFNLNSLWRCDECFGFRMINNGINRQSSNSGNKYPDYTSLSHHGAAARSRQLCFSTIDKMGVNDARHLQHQIHLLRNGNQLQLNNLNLHRRLKAHHLNRWSILLSPPLMRTRMHQFSFTSAQLLDGFFRC